MPARRHRPAGADRKRPVALRRSAGAARHPGGHAGRQGPVPPPGDPGPDRPDPRPRRSTRHAGARRAAARSAGRPHRRRAARHRLGAAPLGGRPGSVPRLDLGVDPDAIGHPLAREIIEKLQALSPARNSTTPHDLLSQAVDVLRVRPILLERHRGQAERALANVDLYLSLRPATPCAACAPSPRP